jgi:O-methyltransferase
MVLIKELEHRSFLRRCFFPRFDYMMTAPQLCFLCQMVERTRDIPGAMVEVGCAEGATTLFLNKYMEARGIQKNYYCIDTFAGFVAEDISHEVSNRGKEKRFYEIFGVNKKKWFDKTMKENGIVSVVTEEADVNQYDFSRIGNIAFALLDVDLYRPIRSGLRGLFCHLSPGGVIIVDDCGAGANYFDGAGQAYSEFCVETGRNETIILGKLGIVEKDT